MGVRRSLVAVALVLGLASGAWTASGGEPDVEVAGTWVLVSGRTSDGPLDLTRHTHITLTFDADGLGGTAPCNDYGAGYEIDGTSFDIPGPGIEQTFAGCAEDRDSALESAYLSALEEVDTVNRDGDMLTMAGVDVELGLRLAPPFPRSAVTDRRWRLAAWTDDDGVSHRPVWKPGLRPFLRFGDSGGVGGRVSASTGCRVMEGRWRMWRNAPRIVRSQWRGRCPERLMDQELAVGNALSEPVLELRDRAGRRELLVRYAHANSPARLVYRR